MRIWTCGQCGWRVEDRDPFGIGRLESHAVTSHGRPALVGPIDRCESVSEESN